MSITEKNYVVIEAGRSEANYWKDLWKYRELFYFLALRDVLVRYKQTVFGVLWALLKPLLTMLVFVFVFGKLAKLPSDGLPYSILVLTGMLPWMFFATAFAEASNSLVSNRNIISKIYFPRLIVPISSVMVSLLDLLISSLILIPLAFWYGVFPDVRILLLPLFILLAMGAAIGAGLLVASLNVKYRDFGYVLPFVIQFGLYVSPVAYSTSIVPEKWRMIYALNPMVGVINGFRWCLTGQKTPLYVDTVLLSVSVVTVLLFLGVRYFRATEKSFADVI